MSTQNPFTSSGTGSETEGGSAIWKIVGVIVAVLIAIAVIGPIIKAAFWIGVVVLAVIGLYSLVKAIS